MTPDASGVVGEQVDRDRRRIGHGLDVVNIAKWREQCIELAALDGLLAFDGQSGSPFILPVIESPIDGFVLSPPVESNQSPCKMVVNRSPLAWRNHEREQAERAVFRAIERVLSDTSTHSTLEIGDGILLRQPPLCSQQGRKRRTKASHPGTRIADLLREPFRLGDQRTNFRYIDDEAEVVMASMGQVAHDEVYVFGLNGVGSGGAVRGEPDFTHAL